MPSEDVKDILEIIFKKGEEFKKDLETELKEFEVVLEKNNSLEEPNLLITILDESFPLIEIEVNLIPRDKNQKLDVHMISGFEDKDNGAIQISREFEIPNKIGLDKSWEEITEWIFENIEESDD